jgi:hypothetical protein
VGQAQAAVAAVQKFNVPGFKVRNPRRPWDIRP